MTKSRSTVWQRVGALVLACGFAIGQRWSLPEFAWGTWVCGLVFAWCCVASGSIHIVLTGARQRATMQAKLPWVERVPAAAFTLGLGAAVALVALVAVRAYCFLFAFYGLFLSVFCPMPPLTLFGPNGFINSDFFTPVAYLLLNYWPMVAAAMIANGELLLSPHPWRRILLPMDREVLQMHLMVLAVPFLSLLAWAILGTQYQTAVVVMLLAGLHLLPLIMAARPTKATASPDPDAPPAA
jgi:hypothetical protein